MLSLLKKILARRHFHTLVLVGIVSSWCWTAAWADPQGPSSGDKQIANVVTRLLQQEHLLKHPLDGEIAARWMKNFLKSLDPRKMYFYQSDVDEFKLQQDKLAEQVLKGDVGFAYTVFKRYLQRVDERLKQIEELLAQPHDFTIDEEMSVDRDKLEYVKDAAEAKERWRKFIKYELLVLKTSKDEEDKKEGQEAIDKLTKRYRSLNKRMHQINSSDLLEIYLTAMTSAFDPHTDYMSPRTYENFNIMMRLELDGIGASLLGEDGMTIVKHLVPGGAAAKSGLLKVNDKIIGVGEGETGEIVDIVDMKLDDAVNLIRGKRGTTLRLEIIPADKSGRKIIQLVREKIELKDQEAKGEIFDAGYKSDGTPYKIGVIDLPSFYMNMEANRQGVPEYRSATRDVRAILDGFNKKGVDAVVLDLRYNGGGALVEAISLTGLFIPEGPVVQVKDAEGRVIPYNDTDRGDMAWKGPLVVLISKFSASASEILAGAIQDWGRGLIVGDHTTHGKGTVQSLLDVGERFFRIPNYTPMGALKITMQQFYRPSGDSTQKRGVLSDIELPSLTTHLDVGEADLDYPIAFDRIDPMSYKKQDAVSPAIVAQLKRLSEPRVKATEKFQKLEHDIDRFKEQKAKKLVTLNEQKFLKDMNPDKEEEKKLEELINKEKNHIERTYYLDEVLNIAVDYMNQLQQVAKAR
ncbi:MAG: carboxy terminal-processing peptidase [Pirellulales bacterium]|nr:carboxy terminal-processing peptidase [Pirellulales bacterium]